MHLWVNRIKHTILIHFFSQASFYLQTVIRAHTNHIICVFRIAEQNRIFNHVHPCNVVVLQPVSHKSLTITLSHTVYRTQQLCCILQHLCIFLNLRVHCCHHNQMQAHTLIRDDEETCKTGGKGKRHRRRAWGSGDICTCKNRNRSHSRSDSKQHDTRYQAILVVWSLNHSSHSLNYRPSTATSLSAVTATTDWKRSCALNHVILHTTLHPHSDGSADQLCPWRCFNFAALFANLTKKNSSNSL